MPPKNATPKWLVNASTIGKWAMADVFSVSIFVAFPDAKALKDTSAPLEPGFYHFKEYVLPSALIVGFLTKKSKIPLLSNG